MRSGVVAPQQRRAAASTSRFRISCCCARRKGSATRTLPAAQHHEGAAARSPSSCRPIGRSSRGARADRRRSRDRARQQHSSWEPESKQTRARLLRPRARREGRAARARVRCSSALRAARRQRGRAVPGRARERGDRRGGGGRAAYRNAIAADPAHVGARSTSACATSAKRSREAEQLTGSHRARAEPSDGALQSGRRAGRSRAQPARPSSSTAKRRALDRASPTCTSISRACIQQTGDQAGRTASTSRASAR